MIDNNEIFRTLLHLTGLKLDKPLLIEIFKLGGLNATNSRINNWMRDLENERASAMPDFVLRGFLQGLFKYRDMKRAEGIGVFNFINRD
jgi:uncharacterized protein YehS (DUF1456 family)